MDTYTWGFVKWILYKNNNTFPRVYAFCCERKRADNPQILCSSSHISSPFLFMPTCLPGICKEDLVKRQRPDTKDCSKATRATTTEAMPLFVATMHTLLLNRQLTTWISASTHIIIRLPTKQIHIHARKQRGKQVWWWKWSVSHCKHDSSRVRDPQSWAVTEEESQAKKRACLFEACNKVENITSSK